MKQVQDYLKDITQKFTKGNATEHTYRSSLIDLSKALLEKSYQLTNEPKRQACGAPDYILEFGDIPVGYIEAKDIGTDLDKVEKSDQMRRYLGSLDNLILTDYLEFRFYRNGEKRETISFGKLEKGKIKLDPNSYAALVNLYKTFAEFRTQTIKNSKTLAEMMAKRAVLVKEVLKNILKSDEDSGLRDQYEAFKKILIHDVTPEEFSDIYAETIAYGLFTARLHDNTPKTFSREEAYRLIPRSNPFLRELFTYVGTKLDERAEWIIDELCDVFRATDVQKMLASFNRGTGRDDPFLHFYETFLGAYNPEKKDSRGVWYTPQPVVEFIVRAVDDVLATKFNLARGLADTSTTTIQVEAQRADKRGKKNTVMVDREVHRVQVLDVATGTGTFLAETVAHIYRKFKGQQGKWSSYVEEHLIPRLYGFELLMASYAMCHMKLELLLEETGYKPKSQTSPRLNVYLTNSLQKADAEMDKLPLIEWFSRESNEASYIKTYSPIMVAIGNPPYSGVTSNKGDLIIDIEPYKYVNKVHFGEKKHWLNDDYVKFMRLGEYFINRNGQGILAYITNHGYIDNPTFRGMRWHLLQSFDEIYVLDLHGNSNKQERNPSGGIDQNVFDIQQGVSIIVATKTENAAKKKTAPAKLFHAELWGSREQKYDFLREKSLKDVKWQPLQPAEPFFYFVPRENAGREGYDAGFCISDLFTLNGAGVVTARDEFSIDVSSADLMKRMTAASKMGVEDARAEFDLRKDVESWRVDWALSDLRETGPSKKQIQPILYRPYDLRAIYYTEKSGGVLARPNSRLMKHMLQDGNVALIAPKQSHGAPGAFVTSGLAAHKSFDAYNINTLFPLYTIIEDDLLGGRAPNLDPQIWKRLQKAGGTGAKNPEAVFDYVYAMLHAPQYQGAYSHFHKDGYPKIPYPAKAATFQKVASIGQRLRNAHLLNVEPSDEAASYPIDGDDVIHIVRFEEECVWINDDQYFDSVPAAVWDHKVGGYFPARKWLSDRKGRKLSFDDISHYQRIIASEIAVLSAIETLSKIDLGLPT